MMDLQLTAIIEHNLGLNMYENATLLARTLYAHSSTQQSLHLLATCLFRNGKAKQAHSALKCGVAGDKKLSADNRYLLALCCFELEQMQEAEEALLGNYASNSSTCRTKPAILNCGNVPGGPSGLYLLGCINRKANRVEKAKEYFIESLRHDPFLRVSYQALCELGIDLPSEFLFDLEDRFDDSVGATPAPLAAPTRLFDLNQSSTSMDGMTPMNAVGRMPLTSTPLGLNLATPSDTSVELKSGTKSTENKYSFAETDKQAQLQFQEMQSNSGVASASDSFAFATFTPQFTPQQRQQHTQNIVTGSASVGVTPEYGVLGLNTGAMDTPAPLEGSQSFIAAQANECVNPAAKRALRGGRHLPPKGPSRTRRGAEQRLLFPQTEEKELEKKDDCAKSSTRRSSNEFEREKRRWSSSINAENGRSGHHTRSAASRRDMLDNAPKSHSAATIRREQEEERERERQIGHTDTNSFGKSAGHTIIRLLRKGLMTSALRSNPDSFQELRETLVTLGNGYRLLCLYECRAALDMFRQLPSRQLLTGWVQEQMGRAYFEIADYSNAKRCFEEMRCLEPCRSEGLDIFSTSLWHLKDEVGSSYLAHQAKELDRLSPATWCAVGNCFSLQKEHETAIKFFQRAIQLDNDYTYAHTLCGHEYVSNEDFDKAVSCYRHAITSDERHYKAWYGLGTIYYRQEKYNLAEYHFRRAISINPGSSVLYCYLGMVLHANEKHEEALETLSRASSLGPKNPQAKYQRALVLMTLENYQEALEELRLVRDFSPREAQVYKDMGRMCKKLNLVGEAMQHYMTALDLDPKDGNTIKAAIERLHSTTVEDEEVFS